jgi:hypothetical protein
MDVERTIEFIVETQAKTEARVESITKLISGSADSALASESPTFSIAATQAGVILGAAAWMSPEQARGKAVDKRADGLSE